MLAVWLPMYTAILSKAEFLMYPGTTDKPKGKLRLLYECNPICIHSLKWQAVKPPMANNVFSM
jgi:hypothetical protein